MEKMYTEKHNYYFPNKNFLSASFSLPLFSVCSSLSVSLSLSLSPVAVARGIRGMAEPSDLLELIT